MRISTEAKKEIRSWALKFAKGYKYSAASIEIEDGESAPRWAGRSHYYANKSGDIIRYPSAYKKAFGKPIYIASTRRIIVGKQWVKQLEIDLISNKMRRDSKRFINRSVAEFIYNFNSNH